jgi:hypothetical protein
LSTIVTVNGLSSSATGSAFRCARAGAASTMESADRFAYLSGCAALKAGAPAFCLTPGALNPTTSGLER